MNMGKEINLPTREEAIEAGLKLFGEVSKVYMKSASGEAERGELIGTRIAISLVESDGTMLASTVERAYCRSERSYNRKIRREIKDAASYIGHVTAIASGRTSTSS